MTFYGLKWDYLVACSTAKNESVLKRRVQVSSPPSIVPALAQKPVSGFLFSNFVCKDECGVLLCLFVVSEELFNELCLNESVDVKSAFACQRLISQKLADAEVLVFVQILQQLFSLLGADEFSYVDRAAIRKGLQMIVNLVSGISLPSPTASIIFSAILA